MKTFGSSAEVSADGRASSPTGRYEEQFYRILNNGTKYEKLTGRTQGFIVLARGAESLQPLQTLCFDEDKTINRCLTARYRLRSGPAFGTLLQAVASDLVALGSQGDRPDRAAFAGDLLPDASTPEGHGAWSGLISPELLRTLVSQAGAPASMAELADRPAAFAPDGVGTVDPSWVQTLCDALTEILRPQTRLVLFCEIAGEPGSLEEWQQASRFLFPRLPERMGIVLSAAPNAFALEEEDPHFLELDLPPLPVVAKTNAYRYLPSAITGDRPAADDRLGLAPAAEALARLVLLPDTRPFTIGIIAEWGRGKSSFMNLVRAAFVRLVVEKSRPDLVARLHDSTDDIERLDTQLLKSAPFPDADRSDPRKIEFTLGERGLRSDRRHKIRERERLEKKLTRQSSRDIVLVEFNAWRYQDSKQIWAGLAKEATEQVEQALPRRARIWAPFVYMVGKHRRELVLGVLIPSFLALIIAALTVVVGLDRTIDQVAHDTPALGRLLQVALPVGSVVFTLWFIAWRAYQVLGPVSQRVLKYVRMPEYADQLGFQEQVLADLRFLGQRLSKRRLRLQKRDGRRGMKLTWTARAPRMVAFVDDLDRCTDEKIREVLQTINLVLGASDFFVFLAVDTAKIFPAIEAMYSPSVLTEDPQVAVRYLEKILQLPFHLPTIDADHRVSLIADLFSIEARRGLARARRLGGEGGGGSGQDTEGKAAVADTFDYDLSVLTRPRVFHLQEVQDTPEELEVFEELSDFIQDNPREIKRLVNVHRLVKILLQRPETPFDTSLQRKLVVWLIFCARWPLHVDQVLREARTLPPEGKLIFRLADESSVDDAHSIRSFLDLVEKNGALLGEDLAPGSVLVEAAHISQMTRTRPGGTRAGVTFSSQGATEPHLA